MSFTDPIADMITRIRNAQLRKLNTVSIPNSRLRAKILDVLKDEGYISNYKILSEKQNNKSLIVDLKYNKGFDIVHNLIFRGYYYLLSILFTSPLLIINSISLEDSIMINI